MATIQIPVLFDMSGDNIIYGEDTTGDFVASHLDFTLDMTTEANDISLNAADISSAILIGDNDNTDNIFYSGGSSGGIAVDNLCNRLAKAITRGKLVHLPTMGNTSNSGIPMGGRSNLYDLNGIYTENGNNDKYAIKYNTSIAPIGDEQMLGQAMARVASIHLVGSPLSAGIFQNKNQVQTDLETTSSQTFNSGNTAFYNALAVQFSKVLGGSKSSAPMNNGESIVQRPIVGTEIYNAQDDYTITNFATSNCWDRVQLIYDGTHLYSIGDGTGDKILKINPTTKAVTELTNALAFNSDPQTGVYYDGHYYSVNTANNAGFTDYNIQKMSLVDGSIAQFNLVDLGASGYGLGLDPSGNMWAFGLNECYKIPLATFTKELITSNGPHYLITPALYFNNCFYFAIAATNSKIYKYDIAANTFTKIIGGTNGADGTTGDDGVGTAAKFYFIRKLVMGSAGQYMYVKEGRNGAPSAERIRAVKMSDYTVTTHLVTGTVASREDRGLEIIGNTLYYATTDLTLYDEYKLYSVPEINAAGTATGPNDSDGVSCPALKSIYEQLMNVPGRSQIMETREVTNVPMPSGTNIPGGFPFIAGDKLVIYLRPKINFAVQTFPEQHSNAIVGFPDKLIFNVPVYNIADSTGSITSQTYSQSSTQDNTLFNFEQAMDGTGVAGNEYFTSAGGTYNNTTGVHTGAGQTTNVDGSTTLDGEWGQVDIGVSTFVKELSLTTNNTYQDRSPREFKLLGSTDGTNWKTLIHETEAGPWVENTSQTFENLVAKPYRYYRYVVITCYNAVNGGNIDARTSLGHFNLKGSLDTEAFIQVGGKAGEPGFQPIAQAVQDISGLITNFTATAQNIQDAFPGNATSGPESESLKWGWMGSANSDSLTYDTTDINETSVIDLHIWKITITL